MKISCEIAQDLLPLYCDGVCSQDSKQAVEAHLEDCEKCRADMHLMEQSMRTNWAHAEDDKVVKAATVAWKKGKVRAFAKGCLVVLLSICILVVGFCSFHWLSTVDEDDFDALAQQAANYLNYDKLYIDEVVQRGNYLAALCRSADGTWSMCVFERDSLFGSRWRANGGKPSIKEGVISSWNYGSPQGEAVLIFCGGNISDEVCWYEFQNSNITYTCPVEYGKVLDVFIIPDSNNINGHPILLDCNQQKIQ